MLRALFIHLSHARWAANLVMRWRLARKIALRFVAGERQEEAIEVVRTLNARGLTATIDVLGESVTEEVDASRVRDSYLSLLDAIAKNRLEASISLKLTALGLDIATDLCRKNMQHIMETARKLGLDVTIDMEDHNYTQHTLDMFRAIRSEDGFDNILTVIQSYLYRSDDDVRQLTDEGAGLRLCKGAYQEPPTIAYPRKRDVDAAYIRQMKVLLDAAREGRGYPGLATHDEKIISIAKDYAAERSIPRDRFEFQMLYGIRTELQKQLVSEGFRMRVYVPFGSHWYPYFMRRLAERPANIGFFVSNFFKK